MYSRELRATRQPWEEREGAAAGLEACALADDMISKAVGYGPVSCQLRRDQGLRGVLPRTGRHAPTKSSYASGYAAERAPNCQSVKL